MNNENQDLNNKNSNNNEDKEVAKNELTEELIDTSIDKNFLEIEELKQINIQLEDKFLRANAEFENIKKRFEKEKIQAVLYANEQFAKDLLPVIDALEIASSISNNSEIPSEELVPKIKEGIDLTIEQFLKCFEKHGISQISTKGEFNPEVHNAIMSIESDSHKKGEIIQVLQKGYLIKDRILRPSMVSIAK